MQLKEVIKLFIPYGLVLLYGYFKKGKTLSLPVETRMSISEADSQNYNQISNATGENRYPKIFSHIKKLLANIGNTRILSFGCSYGLECFSLRKYLPNARIYGLDINQENIKYAKKRNKDRNIIFTTSWDRINREEFYDCIFAMSVLCRNPQTKNIEDCSQIYTFSAFEEQIELLNKLLKHNGFLVIYNSNFLFTDAKVSKDYDIIEIPSYKDSGFVIKFDKNNKRLKNQEYAYSIFRKK
jgi:SAM-dependent methyltransferase